MTVTYLFNILRIVIYVFVYSYFDYYYCKSYFFFLRKQIFILNFISKKKKKRKKENYITKENIEKKKNCVK